jgi:hypothetical protein
VSRRLSTPNRLQCEECGRVSREGERAWTAHLTDDEPEEVAVFCLQCDQWEFGAEG